jgi:hypothetical protein
MNLVVMHIANKTLSIFAAALIVLAVILRNVVPSRLCSPWGRPYGSHYVHTSWLAFWAFLIAGLVLGGNIVLRIVIACPMRADARSRSQQQMEGGGEEAKRRRGEEAKRDSSLANHASDGAGILPQGPKPNEQRAFCRS